MALYLVGYDAAENNHDLQPFLNQLQTLGAVKILSSQWLITHRDEMEEAIFHELVKHLRDGDGLLVQEVTRNAAWIGLLISNDSMRTLLPQGRLLAERLP